MLSITMSLDRTDECCGQVPRIVAQNYTRGGTTKETPHGLKYYESAVDVKRTDLAVVVIFDVCLFSLRLLLYF